MTIEAWNSGAREIDPTCRDEHDEEGNWLPGPCIFCGEECQTRCAGCHKPICHHHDEPCPNGCEEPPGRRPPVFRRVTLEDGESPTQRPTIIDAPMTYVRRLIFVEVAFGKWLQGTIAGIAGDVLHVEVEIGLVPPTRPGAPHPTKVHTGRF